MMIGLAQHRYPFSTCVLGLGFCVGVQGFRFRFLLNRNTCNKLIDAYMSVFSLYTYIYIHTYSCVYIYTHTRRHHMHLYVVYVYVYVYTLLEIYICENS